MLITKNTQNTIFHGWLSGCASSFCCAMYVTTNGMRYTTVMRAIARFSFIFILFPEKINGGNMTADFYLLVLTCDIALWELSGFRLDVYRTMEEVNEVITRYYDAVEKALQEEVLDNGVTELDFFDHGRQRPLDFRGRVPLGPNTEDPDNGRRSWTWIEHGQCEEGSVRYMIFEIKDPSSAYVHAQTKCEDVAQHYETVMPFYVYRTYEQKFGKHLGVVRVTVTDLFPSVPFVNNFKRMPDGLLGVDYMCQRVVLGANKVLFSAIRGVNLSKLRP